MKYSSIIFGIGSLLFVAGCTSGTTYGTGTSHEEQTVKSLTNMLSLGPQDKPDIDYSARPDLVMPADKNVLPEPQQTVEAEAEDQNWPVAPEEKIAALRAAAPVADERSGELPVEYLLSEKEGLLPAETVYQRNLRRAERDGGAFIEEIKRDAAGLGTNKLAKQREQLTYTTGAQRKYLVEPPTEYRTPAATAVAGDIGIDETELARREKLEKEKEKQNDRGMWTDN